MNDTKDRNKTFSLNELKSKSYYPQYIFLQGIYIHHSINGHYDRLKHFVEEILNSELIDKHKEEVLLEIEKELLLDYLKLIYSVHANHNRKVSSFFCVTVLNSPDLKSKWIGIEETDFTKHYDWYSKRKTIANFKGIIRS